LEPVKHLLQENKDFLQVVGLMQEHNSSSNRLKHLKVKLEDNKYHQN
jgi:hypothetical protein